MSYIFNDVHEYDLSLEKNVSVSMKDFRVDKTKSISMKDWEIQSAHTVKSLMRGRLGKEFFSIDFRLLRQSIANLPNDSQLVSRECKGHNVTYREHQNRPFFYKRIYKSHNVGKDNKLRVAKVDEDSYSTPHPIMNFTKIKNHQIMINFFSKFHKEQSWGNIWVGSTSTSWSEIRRLFNGTDNLGTSNPRMKGVITVKGEYKFGDTAKTVVPNIQIFVIALGTAHNRYVSMENVGDSNGLYFMPIAVQGFIGTTSRRPVTDYITLGSDWAYENSDVFKFIQKDRSPTIWGKWIDIYNMLYNWADDLGINDKRDFTVDFSFVKEYEQYEEIM